MFVHAIDLVGECFGLIYGLLRKVCSIRDVMYFGFYYECTTRQTSWGTLFGRTLQTDTQTHVEKNK